MARPKAFAESDVLHAAMEVFWLKGYHYASMQDLVDGMGINRASLYDTFGDKHALYLRTLERYREISAENRIQAIEQGDTARQKIQLLFNSILEETISDPDQKGCFITNATLEMLPEDVEVSQLIVADVQGIDAMLTAILTDGISSGELRADLPVSTVATFLLSQINGLRVMGKTQPDKQALSAVVQIAMSII